MSLLRSFWAFTHLGVFWERAHASKMRLASQRLSQQYAQAAKVGEDGLVRLCPVESVRVGDKVEVAIEKPFTLDGVIVSGVGYVQETALTGEPVPVVRRAGDSVRAGTWSIDACFVVEVTAATGNRVLDGILQAVDRVDGQPSVMQLRALRFVRYFVPLVMAVSAITGLCWWFFCVLDRRFFEQYGCFVGCLSLCIRFGDTCCNLARSVCFGTAGTRES